MRPDGERVLHRPEPYDLAGSVRFLQMGAADPTLRRKRGAFVRAGCTASGPVTVLAEDLGTTIRVRTWGPGAEEALARADRLLGLHDTPQAFAPEHRTVARLWRAHPGLHLPTVDNAIEALVPTILQQLVTWVEATTTWRGLVNEASGPAPGPFRVMLPPSAEGILRMPSWKLDRLGLGRRGRTVRTVATLAGRLQEALDAGRVAEVWPKVPGIGPWTVGHALGMRLGDPDAIIPGDYHLPNTVAWALAREPRADDARMHTLLAPFAGHRFRVVHLLWMAGVHAPRRGPKRARRR